LPERELQQSNRMMSTAKILILGNDRLVPEAEVDLRILNVSYRGDRI